MTSPANHPQPLNGNNINSDEFWMQHALELAQHAASQGEVPVGAIIVYQNEIIGRGWNQPIGTHDPSAHAEIMALRDAARTIHNYRLNHTTLYVTLEPCIMCAGAIAHARVARLVYATRDERAGAIISHTQLFASGQLTHSLQCHEGVCADAAKELLQMFFKQKR